jgi:hypothetical protein
MVFLYDVCTLPICTIQGSVDKDVDFELVSRGVFDMDCPFVQFFSHLKLSQHKPSQMQ